MTLKANYPPANEKDIDYLIQLLSTVRPVSNALKQAIHQHVVMLHVPKHSILVKQGDICNYMYFIQKGAVMAYSIHNRKKITTYISIENEFVSSITGLHGAAPAMETMEAVEDTTLLAMHNEVMQQLFEAHFDFNYIFRVMVEKYYRDAQERSHIIRIGNARERYAYFFENKPGYLERLPVESVASFLDIKPATLLRIKKQFDTEAPNRDTGQQCRRINEQIWQHALYADKNISITSLAKVLNIPASSLSKLINDHYHQHFADYINTHRINRILEQIALAGSLKNYTIEAMASEVGFASRSAFYYAFRKVTGTTPLQYVQNLAEASPVF